MIGMEPVPAHLQDNDGRPPLRLPFVPWTASQLGILREAAERGKIEIAAIDVERDSLYASGASARGLGEDDGAPHARGLGPEAGTGQVAGGPSGNVITAIFTGTARVAPFLWDQWWLFSLLADQPVNGTYQIGTVDVLTEDGLWTIALVSLFLGLEPMFLVNMNVAGSNSDAAVTGMSARIRRSDPFGTTAGTMQPQIAYQNARDFRADRGQFPIADAVDSWTWLRVVCPMQLVAVIFTGALFFGPRPDRRGQVPRVSAQIVRSINQ